MIELRQSTAGQEIPLGYFLDSTDGDTEEASLVLANTDLKLWKWGSSVLTDKNSGGASQLLGGIFYTIMDATDTDTLGPGKLFSHPSGALTFEQDFAVLPANVWDSKYGADNLQVDVIQLGGVAQSLEDLKSFADHGYTPATSKIGVVALVDTVTSNVDQRGTDDAILASNMPTNFAATCISAGGVVQSNAVQLNGGTQSLADLKDFADEGYDPATNKVQGVVLVDTAAVTTSNVDMRGTDDSFLAANAPANFPSMAIGSNGVASANVVEINSTGAASNLASMYDGTGYTDDVAPATQSQIGSLAIGTAAISTTAGSFNKSGAEPETNTYTSTQELDGTLHIVEDVANATDAYYQFDIGGDGIPVSVTWQGYAQGVTDSYDIYAYNYNGTAYEQIGSIDAIPGTTIVTETFNLTTAHVGTSADLGLVRFRFLSADGSAFATDRLLCSYAVVQSSLGFVGGAVWLDSLSGEAGTTGNIGTISRPSSNVADARTIADNNNLKIIHCLPGTEQTLAQNFDRFEFTGFSYRINLGNQSIAGALFENAQILGNDIGSAASATVYRRCNMGNNELGVHVLEQCGLGGSITLTQAGTYDWIEPYSRVAGQGTPMVDFGSAVGDTNLNMRGNSGGIMITRMGASANDRMSLEGNGQFVINDTCTGGSLSVRGNFQKTDNSGSVTITEVARFDTSQIRTQIDESWTIDTMAEHPVQKPPVTPVRSDALMYLYMALRNGILVDGASNFKHFENNTGTAIWKKTFVTGASQYQENTGESA